MCWHLCACARVCASLPHSSPALLMLSVATPGARTDTENVYPPRAGPRGRSLFMRKWDGSVRACVSVRATPSGMCTCGCVHVCTSLGHSSPCTPDAECCDPGGSHQGKERVPTTRGPSGRSLFVGKERWEWVCPRACSASVGAVAMQVGDRSDVRPLRGPTSFPCTGRGEVESERERGITQSEGKSVREREREHTRRRGLWAGGWPDRNSRLQAACSQAGVCCGMP